MAFAIEPPTIPLEAIKWDEIGEEDKGARLLAHIRIGTLDMHLEARAVDPTADCQTLLEYDEDLDRMNGIAGDVAFETLEINGRDYVLFALPYGR